MSAPRCTFSRKHYSDALKLFMAHGYAVMTFAEYAKAGKTDSRVLVNRHDVDINMAPVMRFAELEDKLGVSSTLFVRSGAKGYSLADRSVVSDVRSLAAAGHEIGLHYECGGLEDGPSALRSVKDQLNRLEDALGFKVRGAVQHRVATVGAKVTLDALRGIGIEYDAFEPRFAQQIKYISDSRRRWREGCMCRWVGKADRMQVLTHPIWRQPGTRKALDEILALL